MPSNIPTYPSHNVQKKQSINNNPTGQVEHSKQNHIISNLREELGNLKSEVAKLMTTDHPSEEKPIVPDARKVNGNQTSQR